VSRLAVLEHSTNEALGRIAGATTIVNAVDGLSVNDAVSIANFAPPNLSLCHVALLDRSRSITALMGKRSRDQIPVHQ
jgi:hypothetical protein